MLRRTVNANYRPENRYKINNSRVFIKTKLLTGRWIKGFEAAKSAILIPEGKRQRQCLGAAIFHGNRLLSTGYNLYTKTKPGNSSISSRGQEYDITCHAEQMAVDGIKHCDYSNVKLIVYVVRINSVGSFTTSRPCAMCLDYLRTYGIKIVRFMNENGVPEELALT